MMESMSIYAIEHAQLAMPAGAELLARITDFALAPDASPRWVDGLQIRRHERLPLIVDSHGPARR